LSRADPQAQIFFKAREMIQLLTVQIHHFPRHEKYALCQEIRCAAYDIYGLLVECWKKRHNKTTLARLDTRHEQLRMLVNLAFELGYYRYHHHKRGHSETEAQRRYTAISIKINEVGAMIGGWLNRLRAAEQGRAVTC